MDINNVVFKPSFNDTTCVVLAENAAPAQVKPPVGYVSTFHQYRILTLGAANGTVVWLYGQPKTNRAVNQAGDPNYINANAGLGPDMGFSSASASPGNFQVAPGAPPATPLPATETAPAGKGTSGTAGNMVPLLTGTVETLTLRDDWYYNITSADATATVTLTPGVGF